MKRHEFPRAIRVAALKRCTDADGTPRCEACSVALKRGGFAYDHDIADGLGGRPTLDNCRVLCADGPGSCHARKTAEHDVPLIAKTKRIEAKHVGAGTPARRKITSRGFDKAPAQRTATRPILRKSERLSGDHPYAR